jgi:cytochrome c5
MNKPKIFLFSSFLVIFVVLFSCKKENEEDLLNNGSNNGGVCNTENMSYKDDIAPIMSASCNACHSNQNASGGVRTNSFSNLQPIIENGSLLGSIKHEQGFSNMPQGQSKLPQCSIDKIEAWINQGAKDN